MFWTEARHLAIDTVSPNSSRNYVKVATKHSKKIHKN